MTTTPIALTLSANPEAPVKSAILPIAITNSDNSSPTLAFDASSPSTSNVTFVQPVANTGQYAAQGVPQSEAVPFVAVITPTALGSAVVNLVADGAVDQQFDVTITQAPAEVASVDPAAIVYATV